MRDVRRKHGGSILLQVLLLVSLLSIIVISEFPISIRTMQLLGPELVSSFNREQALEDAQANIATTASRNTFTCVEGSAESPALRVSRKICGVVHELGSVNYPAVVDGSAPDSYDRFPFIDFNTIFSIYASCETVRTGSYGQMPSGFRITPASLLSSYTCINPPLSAGLLAYARNVYFDSPVSSPARETTLAAAGFIEANAGVFASADLLIIAGGDVRLSALRSARGDTPRVTVISATGVVDVGAVSGDLRLQVAAKEGAFLPAGYRASGNDLFPQAGGFIPLSVE